MCGIAGILRISSETSGDSVRAGIPEAWINALSRHIEHRGPDGHGLFVDRIKRPDGARIDLALIHRRLAIIDPQGGRQPMLVSDQIDPASIPPGSPPPAAANDLLAITYNGCIYNHRDLRQELSGPNHRFRTDHSDTEAILHAFRRWKVGFASHLEGMFALGLWDRPHGRLILARDRAGEKPLYTAAFETSQPAPTRCLAFASTIPALVALMHTADASDGPRIDPAALARWIRFGYDSSVPIHGIQSLAPGHIAISADDFDGWNSQPYYQPPTARDPGKDLTLDDLDRLLASAVEQRLEADVPIGCFLSGGIDSSLIAAYAKRYKPDLRTFCVRMPEARYDESAHARTVSRRLNTRHTTLQANSSPAKDLQKLIPQLGLPLGDSSLLPTHWVSLAARQHVTVALSGDGGDELFMGYERYAAANLLRDFGPLLKAMPTGFLNRFHPRSRLQKLARLAIAARHRGYEELLAIFPTPDFSQLAPRLDPSATSLIPAGARLTDPALHEFTTYLPDDLLRKVDTASMAVALEVRSPMLATAVIDRALSTSIRTLTPDGPKSLLRMLARRYLPDAIIARPKAGFAIPIGEWLRTDFGKMRALMQDLLGGPRPFADLNLGIELDTTTIHRMIEEHRAARRDHGQRIYTLMSLAIWARWLRDATK